MPVNILFLAALYGLSVAVVQVPIHHSVVSPVHIDKFEGTIVEYYVVEASIGSPDSKSISFPILFYEHPFRVKDRGDLAQKLNLTLDLDLHYPYVFDSHLQQDCRAPSGKRRYFNKSASSTYKKHNVYFDMMIGAPRFLNYCIQPIDMSVGDLSQDRVTIGGVNASTSFALVTRVVTASLQPFWPSDGVLGLLRASPNLRYPYPTSSTIMDLAKAAGDGSVSLYLGTDVGFGKPEALTLGGQDTVNCENKWAKFPQSVYDSETEGYWHLRVDGFRMGSYFNSQAMLADIVAETRTFVPHDIFRSLLKITGAEYDFASDEYIVACTTVKRLPDLVLKLDGGFELRIPASEYAKNLVPRKDGKCTVLFSELGDYDAWQFGWRMLQPYCWQFDYVNDVLAIAKANR